MTNLEEALKLRRSLFGDGIVPNLPDPVEYIFPKEYYGVSEIKSLWESYLPHKNPEHLLSLYLHIPFCLMRCGFCNCQSTSLIKGDDLDRYLDFLIDYLDYFKDTFSQSTFDNFYIGGGTPSLLSEENLDRLLKAVFSNFKFDPKGQISSELNPSTATLGKLRLLEKYGFNRVSFGVQSLDQEVLKFNNRGYQTELMVKNAIQNAKLSGFKYMNVDLIVGLYGDTPETLVKSFEKIISFRPQKISIYALQPKPDYLEKYFDSDTSKFETFWHSLLDRSLEKISSLAKENRFHEPDFSDLYLRMSSSSCWSYYDLDIGDQRKQYIGDTPNHSIFGAGDNAVSKIEGVLRYETESLADDPLKCRLLGTKRSERITMLDYIARTLNMKNAIYFSTFRNLFGKDFLAEFKESIDNLILSGAGKILPDRFEFLPVDRGERTIQVLLFFSDEEIKKAIAFHYRPQ